MAHIHFRSPLSRDSSASEKHTSGHLHLLFSLKQVDFKNITVQNADLKHGTSIKPSTWSNLFKPVQCLNPFVGPSLTQVLRYFCGTYILDVLVIILQVILPFLMLDCDILLKLGSINQQPWLEDQSNLGGLWEDFGRIKSTWGGPKMFWCIYENIAKWRNFQSSSTLCHCRYTVQAGFHYTHSEWINHRQDISKVRLFHFYITIRCLSALYKLWMMTMIALG